MGKLNGQMGQPEECPGSGQGDRCEGPRDDPMACSVWQSKSRVQGGNRALFPDHKDVERGPCVTTEGGARALASRQDAAAIWTAY